MQEENIKLSLDSISASEETKNKIYLNVLEKTRKKDEKKQKTSLSFKKAYRFVMPIAACVCIMLLSVTIIFGGNNSVSPISHRNSGYVAVQSASDLESIGVYLTLPNSALSPTYEIVDGNIASVNFSIDGKTYFLKASKISGDFSGVTGEVISSESFLSKNDGVISIVSSFDITATKAYWTDGKVNFYLYTYDDITSSEFIDVATSIITK